MIDRTDLDLRINAHRNQIDTVNQTQWQTTELSDPEGSLQRQMAAALVTLANKLDSRSIVPAGHGNTARPEISQPSSGAI